MDERRITEIIIKCLELTASDSDGEALNAIRKANVFRKRTGKSWEQLFDNTPRSQPARPSSAYDSDYFYHPGPRPRHQRAHDDDIQAKIDFVLSQKISANSRAFITSLSEFYTTRGYLTVKQLEALNKKYEPLKRAYDRRTA